jgi:membrane associated rhomboid family serine protease
MRSEKRSALSYVPGLKNNAVLQLIIFSSSAYMMLAISWAIIMIVDSGNGAVFQNYFLPNIALAPLAEFKSHWWTIITYGWLQHPNSFMELVSSMLWLYCFGSVVQMLVGHRQVIPLFTYALFVGGICYVLAQLLPGKAALVMPYFLGGRAGIMALAAAAITLSPGYRFYLSDTFSIPLMVVAGIFTVLMLVGSGFNMAILMLLAGGALSGFLYIKLLKGGYRPGDWTYRLAERTEAIVTPKGERTAPRKKGRTIPLGNMRQDVNQRIIDEILDKINQKGYNSLSREEKEVLLRAGKEK